MVNMAEEVPATAETQLTGTNGSSATGTATNGTAPVKKAPATATISYAKVANGTPAVQQEERQSTVDQAASETSGTAATTPATNGDDTSMPSATASTSTVEHSIPPAPKVNPWAARAAEQADRQAAATSTASTEQHKSDAISQTGRSMSSENAGSRPTSVGRRHSQPTGQAAAIGDTTLWPTLDRAAEVEEKAKKQQVQSQAADDAETPAPAKPHQKEKWVKYTPIITHTPIAAKQPRARPTQQTATGQRSGPRPSQTGATRTAETPESAGSASTEAKQSSQASTQTLPTTSSADASRSRVPKARSQSAVAVGSTDGATGAASLAGQYPQHPKRHSEVTRSPGQRRQDGQDGGRKSAPTGTPTHEQSTFLNGGVAGSATQAGGVSRHGGPVPSSATAPPSLPGGEQPVAEHRRSTSGQVRGRGRGRGAYQNGTSHASHYSVPQNFNPVSYDPNRSYHNPSYPQMRPAQMRNFNMVYPGYESFAMNMQHMNGLPPLIMDPLMARQLVLQQCEYYFSVENLCKDVYLRKHMDDEGFVNLPVLAAFNRVRSITLDYAVVREVCIASQHIEVRSQPGQCDKIRAAQGWEQWVLPADQRLADATTQQYVVPEIPVQGPAPAVAISEDQIKAFQSRQQSQARTSDQPRSGTPSPMDKSDTPAAAPKASSPALSQNGSAPELGKLSNLVGAPVFVPGQQGRVPNDSDVGTSVLTENFANVGLGKLAPDVNDSKPTDDA